jgi:hypothetical protein
MLSHQEFQLYSQPLGSAAVPDRRDSAAVVICRSTLSSRTRAVVLTAGATLPRQKGVLALDPHTAILARPPMDAGTLDMLAESKRMIAETIQAIRRSDLALRKSRLILDADCTRPASERGEAATA